MSDNNNVPIERKKFTKTEKQYLRGMIHNLSLQRLTDQEIVDYLHNEKKIEIARSTATKIRNQVEQEAEDWYAELKQSRYLYLAHFKERIDTLYSVEKHLWEIATDKDNQVVDRRGALAEIHHTEKTLSALYDVSRYLSATQLTGVSDQPNKQYGITQGQCDCIPTGTINHSRCRYCLQVWCPATLKQDWCPNPYCSNGIKGCKFNPADEHFKWVQCSSCEMWFKTPDILAVHNCYIEVKPKAIVERKDKPVRSESPLSHKEEVLTTIEEQQEEQQDNLVSSGSLPSIEIEEEQETEADIYWSMHPKPKSKPKPTLNYKGINDNV